MWTKSGMYRRIKEQTTNDDDTTFYERMGQRADKERKRQILVELVEITNEEQRLFNLRRKLEAEYAELGGN